MGLMGIEVPQNLDGSGASFFTAILAVQGISQVDPSVGVMVDVQNTLVNNAFMRWGSEALKKKYLPQLASGKVGSYCLSESSSGSDAFALKTKVGTVSLKSFKILSAIFFASFSVDFSFESKMMFPL
jgi:alkylation response protein AidB-like acyl-CoA dehydrogenase